jgi:hypothetical protein
MPRKSSVCTVTTIGMDMGKTTLHMVGLDSCGGIVLREKVSRGRIASRLANLPSCPEWQHTTLQTASHMPAEPASHRGQAPLRCQ